MVKFLEGLSEELSLYVRHCAWLNAIPEKPENDKSKEPNKPRSELFSEKLADGETLEMPPCDAFYMVAFLFELGPTVAAGMGNGPITHSEIAAWMDNTGIALNAWEARTLKRLSLEYLGESQRATAIDTPAPWLEAEYVTAAPNRKSEAVRNSLRALAAL